MKLNAGEPAGVDGEGDIVDSRVHEHADLLNRRRNPRHDCRHLLHRDAAGTGREDEPHRIGSGLSSELRVVQ